MMMNMLRDKSKNIQFEAFHVFKVKSVFFERFPLLIILPSTGIRCQSKETTSD